MTDTAPVSVLIPHADGAARLGRCLESLESELVREVLVVMPEAATESAAVVERHPRARAIRTEELLTFARATNLAATRASGDLLFLLNDDTVVEEKAIDRLANVLAEQPDVGVAGPLLLNLDGSVQPSVYADPSWAGVAEVVLDPLIRRLPLARRKRYPYPNPPRGPVGDAWVSGAALMIRRELYFDAGALDECYPHGIEDAALCANVRRRGYAVVFADDARVVHEGGVSGFRNPDDSGRVARALLNGAHGWLRYWRTVRGAGEASSFLLWLAFVIFGLMRLAVTTLSAGTARGPRAAAHALRRDAYREYLRGLRAMRR